MSLSKRLKHRNTAVVAGLATTVALAGGVGVAAANGPGTPDKPKVNSQAETTEQQEDTEEQEPKLDGSITVEEVEGESEQEESARLSKQADIMQEQAENAALKAVPGEITETELGNENGSLIWEVEITQANGSQVEVKVDAANGTVLAQEAEDEDEDEDESDDDAEATTG